MPALLLLFAGGGVGAWLGSQADDAIETVTGERGGIPWLQMLLLAAVAFYLWKWTRK
ncbi:hypothetical protein [Kordiimonas gwangyangensis]|uniref:hypothetical protein n=1 Tax=Kordiimonas gwangyangensis TaxID=288022 RepID=UPI000362432F|nr:hypothetical protein [Kordiimonas gwangyangensis]